MDPAKEVCSFAAILDYSPNSPSLDDAIGDRYGLYDAGDVYLLNYRVVSQRGAFESGFATAEGIVPLPHDAGQLVANRVLAHPERLSPPQRQDLKSVVHDLNRVIGGVGSRLVERESARADLLHDLEEMKPSINVGTYRGRLAMVDRVFEALLLQRAGRRVDKDWMVGKPLSEWDEAGIYIDPRIKNVWNLINMQWIVASTRRS